MDKKKVLVFTEMSFQGSGYYYLMSPILEKMSDMYNIKVVGLGYTGEEHYYNYTIVPCANIQDGVVISSNIIKLWKPDIFICALDIPLQISIHEQIKPLGVKYVAVTPLENPPLTQSWAASLMMFDHVFFISALGENSATDAGLKNASHLMCGIDTVSFHPNTEAEKSKLRKDFGISDEFVVVTVADNQERKNLWAGFEILSKVKKAGRKIKWYLITRENSPVGYKLRDMASDYDLNKELLILERGIPQEDLQKLYAMSNLYLMVSKAEGLGIPILEAMACGTPVMACKTGAMDELLENGRGFLIDAEYKFRDVWGNSWRHMIDRTKAFQQMLYVMDNPRAAQDRAENALGYIRARNFDIPAEQMTKKIEEIINAQ